MQLNHIRSIEAARRETKSNANAAELGINEDFIDRLVEGFYQRVRAHETLGPIFAGQIQDWTPHLATMKAFWGSVALSSGQYHGRPVPAHMKLADHVDPTAFDIWLALFHDTLADLTDNPLTIEYFEKRAQRIARSLKIAMYGRISADGHIFPE